MSEGTQGTLTKLTSVSKRSPKWLKTAVPIFIIKQFGLKAGDRLKWTLHAENNELLIKITPLKKEEGVL